MMEFHTLDDFDFKDKTVILRVDINCPLDPDTLEIRDDNRIRQIIDTVQEMVGQGGKVVILAHQGRKGDWDFISMRAHAERLAKGYGLHARYVDDLVGREAISAIESLEPGDVVILKNVRDLDYERKNLPVEEHARSELVTRLADVADIYVCDAFATAHRSQCSMVGFTKELPSAAGRLMEREVRALQRLTDDPARPTLFIFGGAKFGDAIGAVRYLLDSGRADRVAVVGLAGIALLKASGIEIGEANESALSKELTDENLAEARDLVSLLGERVILPKDLAVDEGGRSIHVVTDLPDDAPALDIGPETIDEITSAISGARTVFMSGPAGMYEREGFEVGTRALLQAMSECDAYTVVGGGHTAAATCIFGLKEGMSYVSTAGGALETFILGRTLPAIEALRRSKRGD